MRSKTGAGIDIEVLLQMEELGIWNPKIIPVHVISYFSQPQQL